MKRKHLLLVIIAIFSFCIKVSAKTNYSGAIEFTNNYAKGFSGYDRYIVTQRTNYGFNGGSIAADSSFVNGGLLTKDEFIYSKDKYGETYLNNGLDYFTMTKIDSGSVYVVKPDEIDYLIGKSLSYRSGVRVTNYIQSDVNVSGSGSKSDPWVFVDKHYVRLDYDDTRLNVATSTFIVPGNGAITTTVTVKSGSIFNGNSCGATYDSNTNRFTLTNINSDVICTLYSYPTNYVITYNSNGGDACSPNYKAVTPLNTIGPMCEPTRTGYTFLGWYDEAENGVEIGSDIVIDQDMELFAHWSQDDIVITYNSNGGNACNPTSKSVAPRQVVGQMCEPTRNGYGFAGWWTEANGGVQITPETVLDESTTVFAHWNQNNLIVTYNCNGGSGTAPSSVSVSSGSAASISSKPCGYKVVAGTGNGTSASPNVYYQTGWSTSSSGTAASSITITNNTTLYATWAKLFTYNSNYVVVNDGSGNWRIKFLSNGSITINQATSVDIFAVGGGGGGGGIKCDSNWNAGAGGGGGGYTTTASNKSLSATSYSVTIGSGGAGGTGANLGSTGGTSSFGSLCSASGGSGGNTSTNNYGHTGGTGGAGGSGGGAGKAQGASYENGSGNGGSFGNNGSKGGCFGTQCVENQLASAFPSGGTGSNRTTCEFGLGTTSGCNAGVYAYSGGGGGGVGSREDSCGSSAGAGGVSGGGAGGYGCGTNGNNGTANTGGGGGGASSCLVSSSTQLSGGTGGSGIVIIRNHR